MVYKVFISTAEDAESRSYLNIAKAALWRMNEFPISAVAISDLGYTQSNRVELARRTMADADIFIGIYGAEIGAAPPGSVETFLEIEYRTAMELGLTCLIFIAQAARSRGDERAQAFKRRLMERHVIRFFQDDAELDAQIVLAVSAFKQTRRWVISASASAAPAEKSSEAPSPFPAPPPAPTAPAPQPFPSRPGAYDRSRSGAPPTVETEDSLPDRARHGEAAAPAEETEPDLKKSSGAVSEVESPELEALKAGLPEPAEAATPAPDEFDQMVNRALSLAQDDLEQIVRRSLELHEAQRQMMRSSGDDQRGDGWMRVRPIFGEPMLQTQFQADVFMIMPFRPQFNAIYEQIIRPVVSELNLTIKRGDEFSSVVGVIMQEVWAAINACRLVIVETTEVNANVYYELGIAHTLGKPAILLSQAQDVKDFPFDIRHLRFTVYENTIAGGEKLAADLRRSILWILNDLEQLDKGIMQ